MKNITFVLVALFLTVSTHTNAQSTGEPATNGSVPKATEAPTSVPAQTNSTTGPVGAVINTQSPLPSPTPRPSPPASPTSSASPSPDSTPSTDSGQASSPQTSLSTSPQAEATSDDNTILVLGGSVLAVAALFGFVKSNMSKPRRPKGVGVPTEASGKSEPKNKDDGRCLNIKKLLDNKINELTDFRGQLEGKIKEKGEAILKETIKGTTVASALELVQKAEKEVARLEKLYKECIIEFGKDARVIVVHGCADTEDDKTYSGHWMPWLKKELAKQGMRAEIPPMPNPWAPDYNDFKKEFEKNKISEDSILIGHSCGCAFLVRWLGETKKHVKKLILVAPWKIADQNDNIRKDFYGSPIDKDVASQVKEVIIFTADNEEEDGKKSVEMFHSSLGGKIVNLNGKGHYTLEDMKTEQFSELLKEIQ